MTQKETQALKVNDQIRLIQDKELLGKIGLTVEYAQEIWNVTRELDGNNEIRASCPKYGGVYVYPEQILKRVGDKAKAIKKFCLEDAKLLAQTGSNERLKAEITTRISTAKGILTNAGKPAEFSKSVRDTNEQIRQMKLLHSLIKPDPEAK